MTTSIESTISLRPQDRITPSSLSTKEMERKIRSIDATQIETIAKAVIARIMMKLNIDTEKIPPAVVDENGVRHQVAYDPASKILQALLPEVITQITQAFATSGQFLQKGLTMQFIGPEGLLNKVASQDLEFQEQISRAVKHFVSIRTINSLNDLSLKLEVPLTSEGSMPKLLFNAGIFVNGVFVNHDCCSLEDFERQANHKHVF